MVCWVSVANSTAAEKLWRGLTQWGWNLQQTSVCGGQLLHACALPSASQALLATAPLLLLPVPVAVGQLGMHVMCRTYL